MADHNEEKERDVSRLEERTKGLERADGRHYFAELVLFLAVLALALLFVNGCRINTPTPNIGEEEKEWVYRGKVELQGLTFAVGEDNKSLDLFDKYGFVTNLKTDGDSYFHHETTGTSYRVSAAFKDDEIRIFRDGTTIVGTFTYE